MTVAAPQAPDAVPGLCPEALLCAITLRPTIIPRNRFFWVYTEPRARRAHGRAHALRRLHREVVALLCEGRLPLTVAATERGVRISYRDDALALWRRITLGPLEASLLRVLLARDRAPVPEALRAGPLDRARIRRALRRLRVVKRMNPADARLALPHFAAPATGPRLAKE